MGAEDGHRRCNWARPSGSGGSKTIWLHSAGCRAAMTWRARMSPWSVWISTMSWSQPTIRRTGLDSFTRSPSACAMRVHSTFGGVDEGEVVQQGQAGGWRAGGQADGSVEGQPAGVVDTLTRQPLAHRQLVECLGVRCGPGFFARYPARQLVELFGRRVMGALAAAQVFLVAGFTDQVDIAPLVVGGEGFDIELACQVEDRGLAWPDPFPAGFGDHTIAKRVVVGASAHAVPRFQHGEGHAPGALQVTGRSQPGQPGTNDHHVQHLLGFCSQGLRHGPSAEGGTADQGGAGKCLHEQAPLPRRQWQFCVFLIHLHLGQPVLVGWSRWKEVRGERAALLRSSAAKLSSGSLLPEHAGLLGFGPALARGFRDLGRGDEQDQRVEQRLATLGTEPLRLDGHHHQPAVADGADLVGQHIGRNIVADLALGLPLFDHHGEHLAELRVALPDDVGEHRFMAGVGEQLQPREPHGDVEGGLVGGQQQVDLVEQALCDLADHVFLVGEVVGHRARGTASLFGNLAHRGPGIAILRDHRDRGLQQFRTLCVAVTDRPAATGNGFRRAAVCA
ncbi:hypothetical protein WR25_15954 [Diploscapter pachys]|uniref:Uncharacterized protein n=1 Tax=Diploscapter pachys TaxID=2018661 RepID=A0A2A2KEP6_9BILA|nr:hypothetical protein WR25_15954 [Diploscapter pachys]